MSWERMGDRTDLHCCLPKEPPGAPGPLRKQARWVFAGSCLSYIIVYLFFLRLCFSPLLVSCSLSWLPIARFAWLIIRTSRSNRSIRPAYLRAASSFHNHRSLTYLVVIVLHSWSPRTLASNTTSCSSFPPPPVSWYQLASGPIKYSLRTSLRLPLCSSSHKN